MPVTATPIGRAIVTRKKSGPPTYYVSAAGNDNNDGLSTATPWKTSAKVAGKTFAPGTTILFRGGDTFAGFDVPAPLAVSTSQLPVVYGSYGTGTAIINGAYDNGTGPVVLIYDISNVSFTNLTITGGGLAGIFCGSDDGTVHGGLSLFNINQSGQTDAANAGLLFGGDAGESGISATVTGCSSHDNAGGGVGTYQSGSTKPMRITVIQTTAYNCATQGGIVLGGVTNGLVDQCVTYGNGSASTAGPVGAWMYDCSSTIIQRSESYGNLSGNTTDGGGFDIDGGCVNCSLQLNYSHDNVGAGFLVYSYSGSTNTGSVVRFNISSNDGGNAGYGAVNVGSDDSNATTGMNIYNNTFICNKASRAAIVISGYAPTGHVANNVIYSSVRLISATVNASGLLFQGNCYYGGGNILWNNTTYATVALWQAAFTTQEKVAGSNVAVTTDPKIIGPNSHPTVGGFFPAALGAFQPQAGSSLFGAGINLASVLGITKPANDYFGGAAPAGYDIGAAFSTSVAAKLIVYNTPIITIGPSIQNVVNTRAPRNWLMAALAGHLYPTPGTNQATGGATATLAGAVQAGSPLNYYEEPTRLAFTMNQLGDASKRGRVLVQYDPGPNDFPAVSLGTVTTQDLIDAMDRWIARVIGAGHMIALCPISPSTAVTTNSVLNASRHAFNAAMATRANPAAGIFYCGTRLTTFPEASFSSMTIGDGLHPDAVGAFAIGAKGDAFDLLPFCDFSTSTLWKDAASYVNPYGQAANSNGALASNTGTLGDAWTSGSVPTGWTVYCNTNGQSSGLTTGISAVCSVASGVTVTLPDGSTKTMNRLRIRLTGTATAAGICSLISSSGFVKGTGSAQYFNWGEFGQASFLFELYGASLGVAPSGIRGLGTNYGVLGGAMNKTIETQAHAIGNDTGVVALKSIPTQSLKLNGTLKPELDLAWSSGETVDATIDIYQAYAEQVETVAYAAPFNLSGYYFNNPATRRPALTGTMTHGQTITCNPPCVSGGGVGLYGTSTIEDSNNNVLATFANNANPSTYVLQTGDASKTIRMLGNAANSYGSLVIDDGPTYAVA